MTQGDVVPEWPANELEAVQSCPVCRHKGRRLLHEGLTDRVFRCAPGVWSLYQCLECGAAYLDPRPTPASIWRAYTSYYTHKPSNNEPPLSTMSVRQRLRRALRNGYVNARYGSNLQPASILGRWMVPALYGKQGEIDHSLRNLPRLKKGESRKVLDIGCGNGAFLKEAMQLGWEAHGIDPDPKAAGQVAGLRVEQGALPETNLPGATFDVVTLSHVIEHTHDPVASLREVLRLLKPDGQVWVATPNLMSYCHQCFQADWIGLQSPSHLVLFSHSSISYALRAAGFDGVRFSSMYPQARGYYHMSWRVAQGEFPFAAIGSPLPASVTVRAAISDLLSALLPSRRADIVVTAMKSLKVTSTQRPLST